MRLFVYEHLCAGGLGPGAPASLRREGEAMLRAVAADFARIPGVRVVTLPDEPDEPGGEADLFDAAVAGCDAALVIAPEFDDLLLDRSRRVLERGRRLLGALPEAIRRTGDKLALARHWQAQGTRTPDTRLADRAPAFPPPWVCKPRHGAGSQATVLVRDRSSWPAALARARAEWPAGDLIVQPYVEGIAASVAFLVGPGQCLPLPPAAQVLSDDGRFHYRGGRLPLPLPLAERAVRLGQAALVGIDGLQGYVGVDLVLGADGDDHAIEINPRLTTSYIGLRRLCRDNLAAAWLAVVGGTEVVLDWDGRAIEFGADDRVG